ncbi:tape measure protein [Pseudoalteromonas sp. KG3]|uniref:tape measure protein n=1 Tax=Pseudoalteromonas sp. KG3 TaxID=2951137 RepID=UPI002658764A|nr:tape measure protein [Pseudoalteromonas sp. KG3]WKD23719.1 tape measure protein [Pseudoalteromonas sp. KG3]
MADKTLELALRIVAEATGKQNIEQLVQELKNIEQSADAANPATKNLSDLLNELEQRAKSAAPQTEQLSDEIDNVSTSTDKAAPAAKKLTDSIDELENTTKKAAPNTQKFNDEIDNVSTSTSKAVPGAEKLSDSIDELDNTTKTAAPNTQKLNDEIDNAAKSASNAAPKAQQYSENLDNVSDSAQKTNKQIKELEAASKILTDQLGNIEAQKAAIARYEQLSQSLAENERAYTRAGTSLTELVTKQKAAKQADNDYIAGIKKAETELAALTQKQKEATTDSAQYTAAIQKQQAELNELKTSQQATAKQVLEYNLNVKEAQTSVNSLSTTIVKNRGEFKQLEATLTATGKDLNNLSAETKQLDQQQVAAKISIDNVNTRLERQRKALNDTEKSADGFGSSIKQVTQDLLIMAGAYIGLDKLKDSVLGVLSAGDRAQSFSAQMAAMMGSIAAGEQATAWIKNFANETGTRLESAQQAFASLKTFGIDPMAGAMQSLVDYNAKLGGSQEKLEGIILAAGQAWAKQKLQGEEILQMVERGIPVWDLLAQVTGKNTVELQKMSESGQLGRDTMKALFDEMGKQADGQAAKSLERLSGQVTLISNKWEAFKIKMADSGVYQVAIDFMKQLNSEFDRLVKDGSIDLAAQKISAFFSSIITDGGESFKVLLDNINGFISGAERVVGAVRIVFNGFTAGIKTVAMAAVDYTSSMTDAFASVLDFVGADDLAQKAQFQADALKAVSQGFYESILEDGKNLNAAWEQLTQTSNEAIKTTVKATNEQVAASTEAQKANVTTVTETAGKAVNDLSLMMSKAGIVTSDSLKSTEEQAKQVYETLQEAYKNNEIGVYELEQAYTKWAAAAIDTASATKQTVPASVQAAAAALGLTKELDELIKKAKQLKPGFGDNATAADEFSAALSNTKSAMEKHKQVLDDSKASLKQKSEAQKEYNRLTGKVIEQETDLARVREIESMSLRDLSVENKKLNEELNELAAQYRNNAISADDYNQQKDRIAKILAVVNQQLGENKTAQDAATASTRAGTQATNDQVKANESASKSLREQKEELERVAASANRASSSVSRYNQSQRASVSDVVDYQEENGRSPYDLDSKEINEERERRAYADTQNTQFNKFSGQIDNASSNKALTELYNKINKQLTYLTREQKSTLNAAISAQQQAIKAQSTTQKAVEQVQTYTPTSTPSYTPPTNNYTPSNKASNGDLNSLTAAVRELITVLKNQQPSNGKTVRLELALPGGQSASLLAEFEEQFLQKLEQLSNTQ